MRRREFLAVVGGAATGPFAVRAQQPANLETAKALGIGIPAGLVANANALIE
jgi:hypothetical protein